MNELLERFSSGETRALAQVITRVENRQEGSFELLRDLFPRTGRAKVIGITGSPGSGKSTIVDRLASSYRSGSAQVGILAVDPTSPYTRGALLGDRIRMNRVEMDAGVYIRSMATRGRLGGLAAATEDVITVLDAARRDPVIVETVGVGQDEIDVVKVADVSVVVLIPGMGDDVQALKAGIMEIGDIFVINKCDVKGADELERTLTAVLELAPRGGPRPEIVKVIATEGKGIEALKTSIEARHEICKNLPESVERKRNAMRERLVRLLEERLVEKAIDTFFGSEDFDTQIDAIVRREKDPYTLVERMLTDTTFRRPE